MYNKEGEKVSKVSSIDDMVYSGTRTPKYTASLKNFFSYRDFDFSFMFVYYGGHVLRDVVAGWMGGWMDGWVDGAYIYMPGCVPDEGFTPECSLYSEFRDLVRPN